VLSFFFVSYFWEVTVRQAAITSAAQQPNTKSPEGKGKNSMKPGKKSEKTGITRQGCHIKRTATATDTMESKKGEKEKANGKGTDRGI